MKPGELYRTDEQYRRQVGKIYFERRRQNKSYWVEKLGGKCVDCGHEDIRVLTFDHLDPNLKTYPITSLIQRANPEDPDLVEEMTKCVLRCANCHLIKSVETGDIGRKRKYV